MNSKKSKIYFMGMLVLALGLPVMAALPVIDVQPADVMVTAGQDAVFSVVATDPDANPLSYLWYFDTDADPETPGAAINPLDAGYTGAATNTLTVLAADMNDIGYYYCTVTDVEGDVNTRGAGLEIPRVVAYFPFDNEDPNDVIGNYEIVQVISNVPNDTDKYSTEGVNNGALAFDGAYALEYGDVPYLYLNGQPHKTMGDGAISFWVNFDTLADQGCILCKQTVREDGWGSVFSLFLGLGSNWGENTIFMGYESPWYWHHYPIFDANFVAGEWGHVAMVVDRQGMTTVFINGEVMFEQKTGHTGIQDVGQTLRVGCGWNTNAISTPIDTYEMWVGRLDEMKVRNYAPTADEIKQEYAQGANVTVCLSNPADMPGTSCGVDIEDLAIFADQWLKDNSYTP